ncbi:MAG TPA: hypothetical protein VFD57_02135 [Clostridia bacterium]|nr:hypothetical protein [Clostridia bacterium]
MEIIILFVVISIISSIIKSVGKTQTAQQGQAQELSTMSVNVGEPENVEKPSSVQSYTPIPSSNRRDVSKKKRRASIAPAPSRINKTSKLDLDIKSISHKRLVEGIVLSEILGPPKSRRTAFKN